VEERHLAFVEVVSTAPVEASRALAIMMADGTHIDVNCSDQEHSGSLDYQPGRIFVRPIFVSIADRDAAPITGKLAPRL
jgi:hypothetical protein